MVAEDLMYWNHIEKWKTGRRFEEINSVVMECKLGSLHSENHSARQFTGTREDCCLQNKEERQQGTLAETEKVLESDSPEEAVNTQHQHCRCSIPLSPCRPLPASPEY